MFKWKESYSFNISEIDKQHKKLFEIGSRIYDLASLNDGYDHYDEIMQIFDELRDYTVYHFNYEEELMQKHGYEQFEKHKFEHDFFIKKMNRLEKSDIDEEQNKTLLNIISFVADWISGHILQSDTDYKDFMHANGII